MQTWLLLAAAFAVGWSLDDGLSDAQIVRTVLRTWKSNEPVKYMDHQVFGDFSRVPIFDEDFISNDFAADHHVRSKRAAAPIGQSCSQPGYTGANCEYPICGVRNPSHPDNENSQDQVAIDAANLANCSESYVVVVDETMWEVTISLESELPVLPTFFLQAEDGTIVFPTSDRQSPTSYTGTYLVLAPGLYYLGPRADTPSSYCTMLMTARTNLQVAGGFTSGDGNERSDFPSVKYAYFDTPSSVVLHSDDLSYPAKIETIGFTGQQNHVTRSVAIGLRYNCTYPYILERYTCSRNTPNDLAHNFFQVQGTTFQGYKFRRIVAYQCILPPATTSAAVTITTPAPPLISCKNGGQLITNLDGSKYCYCLGYYTGADCSTLLCLNGGTLPSPTSERCQCPSGFSGFSCQHIVCTDSAGFGFNAEEPTITLVFRTRNELSGVLDQFVNATSAVVAGLSFDPNYLKSFIVVLFDNGKLLINKRYPSFDDAMVDLNKAIHTAPTEGSCDDITFSAIAAALSQQPNAKSPVYIVTDANPNDSAEKETVFNLESFWRAPLYFFYVIPPPSDGCNSVPDSAGYRDYVDITTRTSGNVFYITNRDNVYNLAFQHMMNTLYRSQLLLSNDYQVCNSQNLYKSVAVDMDVDMLVVVATGKNLKVYITDPFANSVDFNEMFADGQNYIFQKGGVVSGQWFFSFFTDSPTDACSFRVYQKKFNNAFKFAPDYDLFWAFTPTIINDANFLQPIYNFDTAPVFHLTNYPTTISMERVQTALSIYATRQSNQTEVYASNGIWRDACSLHFYFPPFTCQVPDETLYFNFFARDRKGMSIQRSGTMYCTRVHPTPPPTSVCQNGGVMNPSNTSCYCSPEYTGQYCQSIVCYNGGSVVGNQCRCAAGWGGNSCELPWCTSPGINPEFLRYGVDMIFAVELTQQSWASLAMLNKVFQEILRDVQMQNPYWIGNFVLAGFNSTWGGVLAESPSRNLTNIIAKLNDLAHNVPTDSGCSVKLWQSLNSAIITRGAPPGSYIELFQTSPEDDTDAVALSLLYDLSRQMQLIMYGFLAVSPIAQPNGFQCNASIENYYTMFGIVGGTTGNTFLLQPAELANAVTLIPLQYSNGIVYFNGADDCSAPVNTYFPIDAYVQTIQFNVFGFGPQLKVYDGLGNMQNTTMLFYDEFTGLSTFELRKSCDPGWEPFGQYCLRFVVSISDALPFPVARNFCASAGGFLVDDLTSDKNAFLYNAASKTQFWVGLFNDNTQYVWDRGNQTTQPLNQADTFWAGGQQPALDPTKQCVYFDGTSQDQNKVWTLDSCATPRPFLCQKNRYDPNHRPNTIGDNDLPAGFYYATLSTAPDLTKSQPYNCSVEIRVQSDLQIVTGFVTSVGSDDPQGDPVQDSPSNRMISYIHSLDNSNRYPILTDSIIIDAYNGTFYNGLKYLPRINCQYPFATQDFSCPNGGNDQNEFLAIHIGEDEFGNTFNRMTFGHCSKAVITCGNGGVRYQGQCVCNDYWTGSQCTVPICVNGGTRNADQRSCTCPAGYTGFNCEFELCTPQIPAVLSSDGKTFVVMVETTMQNKPTVDQLVSNLANIVKGALDSSSSAWFSNYALVTFDSNGISFSNFAYTDINALVTDLTTQQGKITDNGACVLDLIGVLNSMLSANFKDIVYPNSEIFMFTSAGLSDANKQVVPLMTTTQAKLHYFYSKTTCGEYDTVPGGYNIASLAYGTTGNVMYTDAANIIPLLFAYLPTAYASSQLSDPTGHTNFSCSSGAPWYVAVDRNTTTIYASTTSEFGTISVVNPLGQTVSANPLYNIANQKFYSVSVDALPGIWTFSLVTPPGICYAHIYSTGGAKVFTRFALPTDADPLGSHVDGSLVSPAPGVPNVATFQLVGPPFHRGLLRYVEIYDPITVGRLLRSELYPRGNCSFEYYSDTFQCQSGDTIAIFIYGVDENNQKFRRQEISVCNGQGPPPPASTLPPGSTTTGGPTQNPPMTTTQNTNAPMTTTPPVATTQLATTTTQGVPMTTSYGYASLDFDVVFLIDASQSAQVPFNNFTKFISTLMVSYDVSVGKGAQVGIFTVAPDLEDQPPAVAQLNSITSQSRLIEVLNGLDANGYTDFDHSGQVLDFILKQVSSPDYMSAGYRSNLKNHLIIYITASTAFDVDPTATAKAIISNKQYGIITIGFGPAVDQAKLTAIAGGADCSFTATDFPSLNDQIRPIQLKIWQSNFNGGSYCSS